MYHGTGHMIGAPCKRLGGENPTPGHQTWDPLLVTSGGNHLRPVKSCSSGYLPE